MDFVFMLTRSDRTVANALEVLEEIRPVGLRHIGFKDVGVTRDAAAELVRRIKAMGATTYLEVVSTTAEACLDSGRLAKDIGVDRLLGGTQVPEMLRVLEGSAVQYLPFPGKPFDHPTKLGGTVADVERDCTRFSELGCAGVDLLAYRATEADPLALVRAARKTTRGIVLVAGGVAGSAQVRALAEAGADSFTVGSAAFDGSFAKGKATLREQLEAVLDACR